MKLFALTFLCAAVVLGPLVHWVSRQPMPWWPDTVIMGASLGGLVALTVLKAVTIDWPFDRAVFRLAKGVIGPRVARRKH